MRSKARCAALNTTRCKRNSSGSSSRSITDTWLQSAAPPSAGAISARIATCAGSIFSDLTCDHSTTSSGLTTASMRRMLGQRISNSLRSISALMAVLFFGGPDA